MQAGSVGSGFLSNGSGAGVNGSSGSPATGATVIPAGSQTPPGSGGGGGDLQEKIAAARRQADGLKEQIRAKKDVMADTSREYFLNGAVWVDVLMGSYG